MSTARARSAPSAAVLLDEHLIPAPVSSWAAAATGVRPGTERGAGAGTERGAGAGASAVWPLWTLRRAQARRTPAFAAGDTTALVEAWRAAFRGALRGRAALFVDFDQTLTAVHVYALLGGSADAARATRADTLALAYPPDDALLTRVRTLLAHAKQHCGAAVVVVTHNHAHVARAVLAHPRVDVARYVDAIIGRASFAALECTAKSEVLRAYVADAGVAPAALVFADDDDVQCAHVRRDVPGACVVHCDGGAGVRERDLLAIMPAVAAATRAAHAQRRVSDARRRAWRDDTLDSASANALLDARAPFTFLLRASATRPRTWVVSVRAGTARNVHIALDDAPPHAGLPGDHVPPFADVAHIVDFLCVVYGWTPIGDALAPRAPQPVDWSIAALANG